MIKTVKKKITMILTACSKNTKKYKNLITVRTSLIMKIMTLTKIEIKKLKI